MQKDTLHIKRKKEEEERALAIFLPICTRRHPRNECPLKFIEVCSVCEENHSIDNCPSLPGLKAVYQGVEGVTEQLYYINQKRPHGPRPYQQGMQGTSQAYYNPNTVTSIPSWVPLLILPGPHLLLGPSHLNIMPNQPTIHFNPMLSHYLSGMHLIRGGGPNTTLFPLFCLRHLPNHNHYLLRVQSNPKCLPSRTKTRTIDRLSKFIVGNHHAQLMLSRSRKLTYDLGKFSQIVSLHLGRLRKIKRKVNLKKFHPFLKDYP